MIWFRMALTAGALVLASAAHSTEGPRINGATGKPIECYCTDGSGERWEMGDVICIDIYGRQFTARCEMSQNVATWREMANGCLAS